jgi:hypothetical protein
MRGYKSISRGKLVAIEQERRGQRQPRGIS